MTQEQRIAEIEGELAKLCDPNTRMLVQAPLIEHVEAMLANLRAGS